METPGYEFAVCRQSRPSSREFCQVVFREYDDAAANYLKNVWRKMCQALEHQHKLNGTPAPGWVLWKVDEWAKSNQESDRMKYYAWTGQELVGLIHARPNFRVSDQPDRPILYLEHMASAPTHLANCLWDRRYSEIGVVLLAFGVHLSLSKGHNGIIGLHAADEDAKNYYDRLNSKFGGQLFTSAQTGIEGPLPRPQDSVRKTYLETTEQGANGLLEKFASA